MDCERVRRYWHDARDDGAAPDAEVQAHLDRCESCRTYHDRMNALALALDRLRDETESIIPPASARRVRSAPSARRPGALALAAAIALCLSGLYYYWVYQDGGSTGSRIVSSNDADPPTFPSIDESGATDAVPIVPAKWTLAVPTRLELKGETDAAYMAVQWKPHEESNVRIYWLYPRLPSLAPSDEPADPPSG